MKFVLTDLAAWGTCSLANGNATRPFNGTARGPLDTGPKKVVQTVYIPETEMENMKGG